MVKLYCHKHEPDNVESKSEFEIHIVIKDNTVVVESDSKVIVQKTKKWKISITVAMIMKKRNLTLKKRREKSQHSLRESDSGAIPKNGPKYKRIICYEDSEVI